MIKAMDLPPTRIIFIPWKERTIAFQNRPRLAVVDFKPVDRERRFGCRYSINAACENCYNWDKIYFRNCSIYQCLKIGFKPFTDWHGNDQSRMCKTFLSINGRYPWVVEEYQTIWWFPCKQEGFAFKRNNSWKDYENIDVYSKSIEPTKLVCSQIRERMQGCFGRP